jgi:hypothetical protein
MYTGQKERGGAGKSAHHSKGASNSHTIVSCEVSFMGKPPRKKTGHFVLYSCIAGIISRDPSLHLWRGGKVVLV